MFKAFWDRGWEIVRLWADFTFRRRMPGMIAITVGGSLMLALVSGLALNLSTPWGAMSFTTAVETPNWLVIGAFATAALLILAGISWTNRDLKALDRKRVYVIELRGLRDTSGCPLEKAVPRWILGRREQILVNLRQGQDGRITDPHPLLRKIEGLPNDLATREGGMNREDAAYVLGGLASVPLTVLTGIVTDDECAVTLMDWDRHNSVWRELDGIDDGKRFVETGLAQIPEGCADVALGITVSYSLAKDKVAAKLPGVPLVELELEGAGSDAHWSEAKQIELGKQFLGTMMALGKKSVRTVHLFLVAPSSIALRFGRLYDKRNLPGLIVYQFEPDGPPFPWGVKMPVQGVPNAGIV